MTYCLVKVSETDSDEQQRLIAIYGLEATGLYAYMVVSAVSLALSFCVASGILHMILLHLYLLVQGLTTYEYILQLRERHLAKVGDANKYENQYEPYIYPPNDDSVETSIAQLNQPRIHGFSFARHFNALTSTVQEGSPRTLMRENSVIQEEEEVEDDSLTKGMHLAGTYGHSQ
jgi:hypothetical protein